MSGDIDFTQGGYNGGDDENFFKWFTIPHMEYWWYFREVLWASQFVAPYWQRVDGTMLSDEEQKELIAISMLNYAVQTGLVEALVSFDQMQAELHRIVSPTRILEVRRLWKATYSSLYTGFNSLCNIVYVLVEQTSVWKKNTPNFVMNYTPNDAIKSVDGKHPNLIEPLRRCNSRLEIRSHLDHYWTIWVNIQHGVFMMDENFKKGYLAIRPEDVSTKVDALQRTYEDIIEIAKDCNLVYRELAVLGGFLDQYLAAKGWLVDYTNYQPHGGQRPRTKQSP